ncbi:hypothetical protein [Pelosinus sp. sgz500959]|uniref:hypothetical protein n=1 Tax=Pelosinus sp. sgz500959 TaxID=3242472 RepID=UPI003672CAF9
MDLSSFDVSDFANIMFYLGAMVALNTSINKVKIKVCSVIILTIGAVIQILSSMKSLSSVLSACMLCTIIFMMPIKWAESIELFFTEQKEKEKGKSYMNKKFSNLIASVVIFFCLALFVLAWNWYWVKNDPAVQGLIFGLLFSLLGAIAGGLASGYGSYLGGIKGAKINNQLNEEQREKICRNLLIKQLKFTLDLHNKIIKNRTYFQYEHIIYDPQWRQYVGEIDFSSDEFNAVIDWFVELTYLQSRFKEDRTYNLSQNANMERVTHLNELKESMEGIIKG